VQLEGYSDATNFLAFRGIVDSYVKSIDTAVATAFAAALAGPLH
jgi:hypothetical protein